MGYIATPVYLAFLSGDVDKKMLDTLRQVEASGLRRCGGEQYSKHLRPGTQSREYRREYWWIKFAIYLLIVMIPCTRYREYAPFSCKDVRSWRGWEITWRIWLWRENSLNRLSSHDGAYMYGKNSITFLWTTISQIHRASSEVVPSPRTIYRSAHRSLTLVIYNWFSIIQISFVPFLT